MSAETVEGNETPAFNRRRSDVQTPRPTKGRSKNMSAEIVEDTEAPALPAPNANKKKRMLIAAAGGAVLLLGGGGAAALFLGGKSAPAAEEQAPEAASEEGHGAAGEGKDGGEGKGEKFIDVPPLVVNLRSPDGAARFLKLHFMLVPGPKGNEATIKEQLPVILDSYQPFLRELRPEDLAGSAAVFRLKEELMLRTTRALGPGVVKDVLIQDLVQQ